MSLEELTKDQLSVIIAALYHYKIDDGDIPDNLFIDKIIEQIALRLAALPSERS